MICMQTKICNVCQQEKPLDCFHRQSSNLCGYRGVCKECVAKKNAAWYWAKREKILAARREAEEKRDKSIRECKKCGEVKKIELFQRNKKCDYGYEHTCKDCARKRADIWLKNNKDKTLARQRLYAKKYPERKAAYADKYRKNTREKLSAAYSDYYQRNKHTIFAAPHRRLRTSMSVQVRQSIKSGKNGNSWEKILGYTLKELMAHLEALFEVGMTWENYGPYWHIDHIRPLASFSFSTPKDPEFLEAWAMSNLQPLTAYENRRKGARLDWRPLETRPLLSDVV